MKMSRRNRLKRNALILSIAALFILSTEAAVFGQASSNSCLDCHISIEKLKKITVELEKQKSKKSTEIAGEG
jgi:hypothetical protein